MDRINVFNYLDYRPDLRDAFTSLKQVDPTFTYRSIASKLGFASIGHITWILQGKRTITEKNVAGFSSLLKLNKKEDSYFRLLVLYTNSRRHTEKRELFGKLVAAQKNEQRVVSKEEVEYWDRWYYSAMREVVAIHKVSDDYKAAAKLLVPRITPAEAQKALMLLEQLNYIERDDQGFYKRVNKVLSVNPEFGTLAVRQHQMDMLDLARQGLETIPKEERDISSVTMSMSMERFEQVRTMIHEFRQQLLTLARTDPNPQRVFQVGLQIFPLSKLPEECDEGH